MSKIKPKVKRKLIDDLAEAGPSNEQSKKKKSVENADSGEEEPKSGISIKSKLNKKAPKQCRNKSLQDLKHKNNSAVPDCRNSQNSNDSDLDLTKSQTNKSKKAKPLKVVPIIQTRGMKAKLNNNSDKRIVTREDLANLDKIDKLTVDEIAGGDDKIHHDGIKLSINGSDTEDDFPEVETTEPGEISSSGCEDSDEEMQDEYRNKCVASKVTKVNKPETVDTNRSRSRSSKFNHLCDDPDFRDFLNGMPDDRDRGRKLDDSLEQSGSKHKHRHDSTKRKEKQTRRTETPVKPCNFKSPSDTTLYSPGLHKANHEFDLNAVEKISNFVENIRLDNNRKDRSGQRGILNSELSQGHSGIASMSSSIQ